MYAMLAAITIAMLSPLSALAQDGPKVFIDSVENVRGAYTGAAIISAPEIAERFQATCRTCRITIKKESADYIVVFAAVQSQESSGRWTWVAYENKDGLLLRKGNTLVFDNSIKDVAALISAHWSGEDIGSLSYTVDQDEPVSRVYFYREKGGGSLNPIITCNGARIAKLTKKKYFALILNPGRYEIGANLAGGSMKPFMISVEPGQDIFIYYGSKFAIIEQFGEKSGEEAIKKIAKLKPEEDKNIYDPQNVSTLKPQSPSK